MSTSQKVLLFATGKAGVEVARYLSSEAEDQIARLYLSTKASGNDEIIQAGKVPKERVHWAPDLKDLKHLEQLRREPFDYVISVYWPYLFKQDIISLGRKGSVNFHPALLPINRGWYPHVHSLIDGTPTGVTIHAMDENADTGPIWAQKEVPVRPTDTAKTIYDRLMDNMVSLFKEKWPQIRSGKLTPQPQKQTGAIYHDKTEVNKFDEFNLSDTCTVEEVINRLRARSFGNRGFAYFMVDGKKIYLNLRLSETPEF